MNRNDATIVPNGNMDHNISDTNGNLAPCDGDDTDDKNIQSSNKKRQRATTPTSNTIIGSDNHNHSDNVAAVTSLPTESSALNADNDTKVKRERDDNPHPPHQQSQPIPLYQPSKKMKKKHMDPKILQFRTLVQNCCKNNDLYTAIQAYCNDAIPNQIRIEAQTFYNLLHLCSNDNSNISTHGNTNEVGDHATGTTTTSKSTKIHVGTPKASMATATSTTSFQPQRPDQTIVDVTIDERRVFAERVKSHMDQLQISLTENAYTALVRVYCSCCSHSGDGNMDHNLFHIAERILNEAEHKQQCKVKLRLYTPLLQKYCELGLLRSAIQIWYRISKQDITLTEVEYCSLLQCCNNVVDHCNASTAAMVFERVLTDLAEDILIPSHATRRTIIQWFQSKRAITCRTNVNTIKMFQNGNDDATATSSDDDDQTIKAVLQQIQLPYENSVTVTMGPIQCNATNNMTGWVISEQCPIDANTGTLLSGCLQDAKLQPISISSITWDHMKQMNESIAITNKINDADTTDYQGGGKGRKVILDERAIQLRRNHWNQFHTFLTKYDTDMDILIDGANVGYYEQNFNGAPKHVDYHQINWMVQHIIHKLKKSVLLIMHSRHFASNLMPKFAQPIVQGWIDQNILYQTPPGMNDDWFWLHAALHFGPGTCIVTNDEMRDHHFQMIAPRSFIRWRDRHQIHFQFGHWIQEQNQSQPNDNGKAREVILQYPDPYSRRIQRVLDGLVIPLPKRGDTNRFMDGVFVANDEEPNEEMFLCIRPI